MKDKKYRNIRLGALVIITTSLLIAGLYFIGDKRNLFSNKFTLHSSFKNVSGLMIGNNVRFGGIDIGTVSNIEIRNDTNIFVSMMIKHDAKKYIRISSTATIGTDGLVGNKLINISSIGDNADIVKDGDVLISIAQIETDEAMRTLNNTNDDIAAIASNLRTITDRLNKPNTLWSLLNDTLVSQNVKESIVNIRQISDNTAALTGDLNSIVKGVKAGKGTIGALLVDNKISKQIDQTLVNIHRVSDTLAIISGDLSNITRNIKNGEGAVGTLLVDTAFANNLNRSMENIRNGTKGFDENMEALKHSIFFRGYFRKLEKKEK